MANVNLISARRAERVRLNKIARGILIGLLICTAIGLGSNAYMTSQVMMARGRIAAADEKLEELRPILEEIEMAKRERERLQPKLATLTQAQAETTRWHSVLEGLQRAIPQQTWLTNLRVERPNDGSPILKLNGLTVNQARVGETMYRLSQQPEHYSRVDLQFTQTTRASAISAVEFELSARMETTDLEGDGDAD